MSEIDSNGFFIALRKQREQEEADRILMQQKLNEDRWWRKYENDKPRWLKKEKLSYD